MSYRKKYKESEHQRTARHIANCNESFKDATWKLTHKNTSDSVELNNSEMVQKVKEGYIIYHNKQVKTYGNKYGVHIDSDNESIVNIRCIDSGSATVSTGRGYVQAAFYQNILPDYDIECWKWYYQCRGCDIVLKNRNKIGDKYSDIYCIDCYKYAPHNAKLGRRF